MHYHTCSMSRWHVMIAMQDRFASANMDAHCLVIAGIHVLTAPSTSELRSCKAQHIVFVAGTIHCGEGITEICRPWTMLLRHHQGPSLHCSSVKSGCLWVLHACKVVHHSLDQNTYPAFMKRAFIAAYMCMPWEDGFGYTLFLVCSPHSRTSLGCLG